MVLFALGFVLGAWLLQQQSALPTFPAYLSLLVLILFSAWFSAFRLKHAKVLQRIAIVLFASLLGFFYASIFATLRLSDALPKAWESQNIEVVGIVATMPEFTAHGERFRFDVETILSKKVKVPKHISLSYYANNSWGQAADKTEAANSSLTKFNVGERWKLTVRLKRPHTTYNPNGFDFESWVLAQNIRAGGYIRNKNGLEKLDNFVWRLPYMIEYCRQQIGSRISQVLRNHPYAGVIRGLVIGDDSQISNKNWDVYLRTGTNHLMSISGLHITMLAGLAFGMVTFLWRRFPSGVMWLPTRQVATLTGAFTAILYACLAGLSVPTQRTLIMLITFAVALMYGKRITMSRVLSIALLLVVLFDPWAVIAPGFWLSFSAVAIIAYASANRLKVKHWLREAVNTQWAITLGLLPLLILMFGQASIFSPIANALAIPLISLLVVPLAILGAILPIDFILSLSHAVLALCMTGLAWLASFSTATWQQAMPPIWTIGLAIVGILWLLLPRGFPQRWLGVALLFPMMIVEPAKLAEGEMQVTVLDVGQGLAVLIKTADHTMLYDTGRSYNKESDAGNKIILPYLRSIGVKHLDLMVISHDDDDHSGGAHSLMTQMQVKKLTSSYDFFENNISALNNSANINQEHCIAGQTWAWDSVKFEVLYPTAESYKNVAIKDNNRSCVLKVTSTVGSVLLTGDIERSAELSLLDNQKNRLASDVLVAPHHGSKTSSTIDFIASVSPKHVVFTVGYLNRFNHPKVSIQQRYLENQAQIYRSDIDGAVMLDFQYPAGIQVNTWRKQNPKYWHDQY